MEMRRWDSEFVAGDRNSKLDLVSEFGRRWILVEILVVL
jgi:hypothetical protein